MKKKKARKVPLDKRIQAHIKTLRENKKLFASYTALLSLILLIGSTFAWSSYSSWVDNHVQAETGTLTVRIVEEFNQDSILQPNDPVTKQVTVKNDSDKMAVVRVKLTESTAFFRLDKYTGMLEKKEKKTGDKVIRPGHASSWEEGSLYESLLNDQEYYVLDKVVKEETFYFDKPENRKEELKIFNIGFSNGLVQTPIPSETNPYWIYEDGYFYYSQVLKPREITPVNLIENVSILVTKDDEELTNLQKNQLYNLDVTAAGIIANETSLENWEVSDSLRALYESDPLFEK